MIHQQKDNRYKRDTTSADSGQDKTITMDLQDGLSNPNQGEGHRLTVRVQWMHID
eukprot:m.81032 g.81032  ORF g.81032 m.81032 type:complete len:55 (+) comp12621_c0_seq4:379-543(+)